jgi:ABC-type polysaccharide/polyol phosphate export permease
LYHRNVKVLDIYLARLLLEVSGATISFMMLTLFFWSIGWMHGPEDVLLIMEAWFLLALFGAGLAVFLGSLSEEFEVVEKLWHPASYLLFPLSGAAYLVSSLPPSVQPMALKLPMVNGVEMLREGYFGSEMTAVYDLPYFVCSTLLVWLLALVQLRKVSRRAIAA